LASIESISRDSLHLYEQVLNSYFVAVTSATFPDKSIFMVEPFLWNGVVSVAGGGRGLRSAAINNIDGDIEIIR
jgi:hypothetical protein